MMMDLFAKLLRSAEPGACKSVAATPSSNHVSATPRRDPSLLGHAIRRVKESRRSGIEPRCRVWHGARIAPHLSDYELLDSGGLQKLERFGDIVLARPCAQAVWQPASAAAWRAATATFSREGGHRWQGREKLPATWIIEVDGIAFQLSSTDFGHLGIFPEQREQWQRIAQDCAAFSAQHGRAARVLNLFAYSGGSTLAAARAGAEVCHVDASRGMVDWARRNAGLNALEAKPVRWIVDDVMKFLEREVRRGQRYDLLILDPPSYGRGAKGEIFKIENDLPKLLGLLARLLSESALGVLLSCHTPELTPIALRHLLAQACGSAGTFEQGEMLLRGAPGVLPVPSGSFARWARTFPAAQNL